jgi:hypothetical protein
MDGEAQDRTVGVGMGEDPRHDASSIGVSRSSTVGRHMLPERRARSRTGAPCSRALAEVLNIIARAPLFVSSPLFALSEFMDVLRRCWSMSIHATCAPSCVCASKQVACSRTDADGRTPRE